MNNNEEKKTNNANEPARKVNQEALNYHIQGGKPGKIEVISSKPCNTEKQLSLAYSPGVADVCLEIAKEPSKVFDYTAKGNLVAVITNGTAVLGLGDIGPLAGKPVMEGKAVLFKQFAGIDVFDIELKKGTNQELIETVKSLEPTFGGINLEDIKAPECFEIEEILKREMKIPVFHDDQHGTAIISGAALLNACLLVKKNLKDLKVVVSGAGASALMCSRMFVRLGVKRENILMCDSQGVLYKGRTKGMNSYKEEFANETSARTIGDAIENADIFLGLSTKDVLTPEMIKKMKPNPIIFALANPNPEIDPRLAKQIRPDAIIATGRSDFPNQVNNVLGYPSIFRGALDTRATQINEEMKLAAVHALAKLAREEVPDSVSKAYGGKKFRFGPDYIIPKPFDPRVILWVAPAVAKAAMETGVAQLPIKDFEWYHDKLEAIQGPRKVFSRNIIHRIQAHAHSHNEELPLIAFPEPNSTKIMKAISLIVEENICRPIIVGDPALVKKQCEELNIHNLNNVPIINPPQSEHFQPYIDDFYKMRQRRGLMMRESKRLMHSSYYFAAMMVKKGHADGVVTGASQAFADAIKPILRVIGPLPNQKAVGVNFLLLEDRLILIADTAAIIDPTAEEIVQIAEQACFLAEYFNIKPKVSMLSYSNFTGKGDSPAKMQKAAIMFKEKYPNIMVDGDMQADVAVNPSINENLFPFCPLNGEANVLVFPNLEAANISYKLLQQFGKCEVIGPVIMGLRRAANVLQVTTTVDSIVQTAALTALEAQFVKEKLKEIKNR